MVIATPYNGMSSKHDFLTSDMIDGDTLRPALVPRHYIARLMSVANRGARLCNYRRADNLLRMFLLSKNTK